MFYTRNRGINISRKNTPSSVPVVHNLATIDPKRAAGNADPKDVDNPDVKDTPNPRLGRVTATILRRPSRNDLRGESAAGVGVTRDEPGRVGAFLRVRQHPTPGSCRASGIVGETAPATSCWGPYPPCAGCALTALLFSLLLEARGQQEHKGLCRAATVRFYPSSPDRCLVGKQHRHRWGN